MNEDNGSGSFTNGWTENLTGMNNRGAQISDGDQVVHPVAVLAVQEHNPEVLFVVIQLANEVEREASY